LQWSNPLQLPSLQRQIDWTAIEFGAIWTTRTSAITVDSLAISPDGDRLLVAFGARRGTSNNPVWHHFLSECHISGRKTPTTIEVETQFVGLRFAPDGASWIAVRRNDDRPDIGLFTGFNRAPLAQFRTRLWPGKTSFSPDGRYLAIARHKSVLLLTANELTQTAEFGEHEKVVKDLAFSPDSNRLISVSNDGTIRVWDVAARQLISKFKWDIGAVSAVAFAPDGLTCAAAGTRGQIVIWDME
jgi:WD40 repeat protein